VENVGHKKLQFWDQAISIRSKHSFLKSKKKGVNLGVRKNLQQILLGKTREFTAN
jgi:hypothetical protein